MNIQDAIEWIGIRYEQIPQHVSEDESFFMATKALREKQERENPKPLTLEELGKMPGEPVFIATLSDLKFSCWAILDKKCPVDLELQDVNIGDGNCYATYDYGKTWLAYRHKPEAQNE